MFAWLIDAPLLWVLGWSKAEKTLLATFAVIIGINIYPGIFALCLYGHPWIDDWAYCDHGIGTWLLRTGITGVIVGPLILGMSLPTSLLRIKIETAQKQGDKEQAAMYAKKLQRSTARLGCLSCLMCGASTWMMVAWINLLCDVYGADSFEDSDDATLVDAGYSGGVMASLRSGAITMDGLDSLDITGCEPPAPRRPRPWHRPRAEPLSRPGATPT